MATGPLRILMVDDDPEEIEIVRDLLDDVDGEAFDVLEANTYADGMRVVAAGGTDMCLVDYRLGARNGVEFIGEAASLRPDIPSVLLTGQGGREVDRLAMAAGAVDYLSKNELTPARLERTIRYAVERVRRQRAESRFRGLIENSQDLISIIGPEGTLEYVSPSLFTILGYDPTEKVGSSSLLEIHPADRPEVERTLREVREAPPAAHVRLQYRVAHRDGSWRTLDTIATNHLGNPAILGIVAHSRDITPEVASQRQIEFQARLLGVVGQAVIATDLDGIVTYWNTAAERMYGWTAGEATGSSILELTTPATSKQQAEDILDSLREGRSWAGEFELIRKDGSTFVGLVTNSPISDESGELTGIIGVSSDITHLKTTEDALRERVKELRALHRAAETMNDPGLTVDEKLQRLVDAIPPGFLYPEVTEARVVLDDRSFTTAGFRETDWMLSAPVGDRERNAGHLYVALSEPRPERDHGPFINEERELLENMARMAGEALERDRLTRMVTSTFVALEEAVLVVQDRLIVDANPAAERIFGYSRSELVGATTEKIHEDRDAFARFGETALPTVGKEGVYRGTFPMRRKDGTLFEAEQTVTLLHPAEGLSGGVVGSVRDISERSRAEADLRASEQRFRQIAEHIADAFWISSVDDNRLEYVSPAFEEIWGVSREALARDPALWTRSILPSDRERVMEAVAGQAEGGYEEEYRIVRSNGDIRWVFDRAFPVRNGAGEVEKIIGVAEDVTERKLAEERFAVLSHEIADAIHVVAPDGRIRSATPSAESVLGYAPEELVDMSVFELVHPEDREEPRRMMREVVVSPGAVARSQFRIITREGETRHVESVGRNRLDHPAICGVVVTTRDVTERRRLEEQLRQSQKMEAVGRLAGGIAHDFNNLLTVIRSQTDLMLMDMAPENPLRPELEAIQTSADRAAKLTSQLLAFSREQVLQPRVVDLSIVARGMAQLLERVIGEDIVLLVELGQQLPAVRVDPGQLEQVVMNLAVNARDAMPGGGTLTLRTRRETVPPAARAGDPDLEPGDYVVLEVSDTGSGMDPETSARMFEPFFTTKEMGKGTGLGLSMVYGVVKQSGGSVTVKTEVAKGTTFLLFFPAVTEQAEEEPVVSPAARQPTTINARVLVVEDDQAVRRVATKILERAGLTVVAVDNAEAGLDVLADDETFDLVLTDLVLPGMSGRSLVDRLLEAPARPRIVVMSGYAEDSPGHRGDLPQEVSFLPKPFSPDNLVDAVRDALTHD